MKANWERIEERLERAVDVARLRWLCGCGRSRPYAGARAYPICDCGQRMRILDEPGLGYVGDAGRPPA